MSDHITTILLVEDDAALQEAYKLILESQGYRVLIANDGQEALGLLRGSTPDLILLDYFMPRMDGKTFLQNFETENYPHTKIVVMSNISDELVLTEMMRLGAHKNVLKASLSPAELLTLVEGMTT